MTKAIEQNTQMQIVGTGSGEVAINGDSIVTVWAIEKLNSKLILTSFGSI